jgi:hypothetical protein
MPDALQAPHLATTWLNGILFPLASCHSHNELCPQETRYRWLAYVFLLLDRCSAGGLLEDALGNYWVFLPSSRLDPAKHLALIAAAYPRLFALMGVVVAAAVVLKRREWLWIERRRFLLGVTVVIAGISVVLDAIYFHRSLFTNLVRCVMLGVWLSYFHVSKRVNHVFRTRDWEKFNTGQVLS